MASKELIEKVAREVAKSRVRDPEECVFGSGSTIHGFTCHQKAWEREFVAAQAAISTILAALQDPTEAMLCAAAWELENPKSHESRDHIKAILAAMLNASPLGEQSE